MRDNLARKQYRKIGKFGNSLGISIPKEFVDELSIQQGDVWEMVREGGQLIIKPTREEPIKDVDPELMRSFNRAVEKYDEAFRNLRDR